MTKVIPNMHLFSVIALSTAMGLLLLGTDNEASASKINFLVEDVVKEKVTKDKTVDVDASPARSVVSGKIIRDTSLLGDKETVIASGPFEIDEDGLFVVEGEKILPPLIWSDNRIHYGTTLSGIFSKAGISNSILSDVLNGEGLSGDISKIYPGQNLRFGRTQGGQLLALELTYSPTESLKIERTERGFVGGIELKEPKIKTAISKGVINGSLYLTGKRSGMSDKLTMNLADIFAWDIDFAYDIHKGDSFEVVYEELSLDGKKVGTGNIMSAMFVNQGEVLRAIRHVSADGHAGYYSPEGKSLEKAFLRQPVSARVSSSFNLQRRHPVLNIVRPHEGTDYAAPPGTPIVAAGSGKIQFAGWKGGYGRTVVIKHGDGITTLYAHMSKINPALRKGERVTQGQKIGQVGSSGMVTGPHLHYEFRVNGSPRNSRTVRLPNASPVPASEMAEFKRTVSDIEQQIAILSKEDSGMTMLSSAK
jgi:murein DD-endopeptidase MepM/ murein hydrolase activator NlpD